MEKSDQSLKEQLVKLLEGGNAHATFEDAVGDLSDGYRGRRPADLPYSVWELVEHIRIAQYDILDFSTNENYKAISWPDGYWPKEKAPTNDEAWENSIDQIKKNRQDFIDLITDDKADLYKPFSHGDGQNLLREALLIADHSTYHIGQIIVVRRLLGQWK